MFERFTEGARRMVVLAQEEARLLEHNYIGTEHLLLGLLHDEEGLGPKALTALGVSLARVRAEVEEIVGHGSRSPSGHIPFTPRAKRVLELSLGESLQLGDNHVAPHHILLGLLREGQGVAFQVLVKLGVSRPVVRDKVLELVATATGPEREGGATTAQPVLAPDGPRCHACRSDLTATLASRLVTAAGDAGTDDRTVAVLYCRACGRAMGVLPQSTSATT